MAEPTAKTLSAAALWLPVLAYILLMTILLNLGFWQLGRAVEKQQLIDQHRTRQQDSPMSLQDGMASLEALRYRRVSVKGEYDADHQFLVDNQVYQGQNGYFVMTPLRIDGSESAVLVNRGWVPANPDRQQLPEVTLRSGQVEVTGMIKDFPAVGLRLEGAEIPAPGWPAVVQLIDSQYLQGVLGTRLMPYQLLLAPGQPDGYTRDWQMTYRVTPDKHRAYAVQWFSLAGTLTLLFVWLVYRFRFRKRDLDK